MKHYKNLLNLNCLPNMYLKTSVKFRQQFTLFKIWWSNKVIPKNSPECILCNNSTFNQSQCLLLVAQYDGTKKINDLIQTIKLDSYRNAGCWLLTYNPTVKVETAAYITTLNYQLIILWSHSCIICLLASVVDSITHNICFDTKKGSRYFFPSKLISKLLK